MPQPLSPRPLLSIIVTTHHRAELLPRALESVKALGAQVQIVLCSDEGSQPTRAVAATHLRDSDIFLCMPGHRGPSDTRNAGLQFATGDFVGFLDDDDTLAPELRQALLPELHGETVFFTSFRKQFETRTADGRIVPTRSSDKRTNRKPISEILIRNFVTINSVFAPRNIASQLRFDRDLTMSEDWDFLLQLYAKAPFRHVDVIGSNWHIMEGAEMSRNRASMKERARSYARICAKNPVADAAINRARQARLQELGGGAE